MSSRRCSRVSRPWDWAIWCGSQCALLGILFVLVPGFALARHPFSSHFEVVEAGMGANAIATRDLDGDSWQDLVVSERETNAIAVLSGALGGTFSEARRYPAGFSPRGFVLHDLDGDGVEDLVAFEALNYEHADSISVWLGSPDGRFQRPTHFQVPGIDHVGAMDIGDVNGDGVADLVCAARERDLQKMLDRVAVFSGKGDGTFGPEQDLAAGRMPWDLDLGDLNRDGILDFALVSAGREGGDPAMGTDIWIGNGDGTFVFERTIVKQEFCSSADIADVDRDGWNDLVVLLVPDPSYDWKGNASIFWGKGAVSKSSRSYSRPASVPGRLSLWMSSGTASSTSW